MTITIPPELEKRVARTVAFNYWSAGQQLPDPLPIQEYILERLEGSCECAEGDMILDPEGHFLADRLWSWEQLRENP